MAEKMKRRLNEAELTDNTHMVVDPPSPIARHVKWRMARTNAHEQMTSTAAQEISKKIVSLIFQPIWMMLIALRNQLIKHFFGVQIR